VPPIIPENASFVSIYPSYGGVFIITTNSPLSIPVSPHPHEVRAVAINSIRAMLPDLLFAQGKTLFRNSKEFILEKLSAGFHQAIIHTVLHLLTKPLMAEYRQKTQLSDTPSSYCDASLTKKLGLKS